MKISITERRKKIGKMHLKKIAGNLIKVKSKSKKKRKCGSNNVRTRSVEKIKCKYRIQDTEDKKVTITIIK